MITLNGRIVDDADELSVAALLSRENYVSSRVAVECNGRIIPKAQYEHKQVTDGDVLEVVCFVGGG
ncbi:MAG: thiamine biosynthesis protein ThiS [Acidobacteria bacterium]|nr:MAG: thiamine biosynthesis protein ThiS [Acidobacteriota bacterium]